jgi:hypothetical protein
LNEILSGNGGGGGAIDAQELTSIKHKPADLCRMFFMNGMTGDKMADGFTLPSFLPRR